MASEVSICNAALQLVKHGKQITSLTQGTKEASACELIYAELRDLVLESHQWNFATKRLQLPRLTTAPVFEWDYAYGLPADFLRSVSVHRDSDGRTGIVYKIEGATIVTDCQAIYLRYIARVTDPNLMTPSFRLALAKLIASRLAVALDQSASRSERLYGEYVDQDLPAAKSADAVQDYPDQLPESEWITGRHDHVHHEPADYE